MPDGPDFPGKFYFLMARGFDGEISTGVPRETYDENFRLNRNPSFGGLNFCRAEKNPQLRKSDRGPSLAESSMYVSGTLVITSLDTARPSRLD